MAAYDKGLKVGCKAGQICPIGSQSCKFQKPVLSAMPSYLRGEFFGCCIVADGCRVQALLAAIFQEVNASALARGAPVHGRPSGSSRSLNK